MSLSGMLISRIEDGEKLKNVFEISGQSLSFSPSETSECFPVHLRFRFGCCCRAGGQCERTQVACNSQHDLQDWLDLLTKHTHAPAHKPQSTCHTVRNAGFFLKSTISAPRHPPPRSSPLPPPSCPPSPPLLPDTRSLVGVASDTLTTRFLIPPLMGRSRATAQCGGPWSRRAPPNPGA